jgi:hypothetical protein
MESRSIAEFLYEEAVFEEEYKEIFKDDIIEEKTPDQESMEAINDRKEVEDHLKNLSMNFQIEKLWADLKIESGSHYLLQNATFQDFLNFIG